MAKRESRPYRLIKILKYFYAVLLLCLITIFCFEQDEIGLNEWALSLRTAHKNSLELLGSMARKAVKFYGADVELNSKTSPVVTRSTNGN